MNLGIDATNLKAGGGLVHLKQLLENKNSVSGLKVSVIGGNWLKKIDDQPWLEKVIFKSPFASILKQEIFKRTRLPRILRQFDLVFVPGGTFYSKRVPYVSMSRNMLVFEKKERNRFPVSFNWFRYILLEWVQVRSFKNAAGVIFISKYAKEYITNKYPFLKEKKSKIIYHGISDEFRSTPKRQLGIDAYSTDKPFKLLYVSIVNFYKHQWIIIEAVKRLHKEGFNIHLDLVGPTYKPAKPMFEEALENTHGFVKYHGAVDHSEISKYYKKADMFIFGSTCENMPNILVEAMSSSLPILCSNYGPMPEILGEAGKYMDPTDVNSVYSNLKELLLDPEKRESIAIKAFKRSQKFSWEKTVTETFAFLQEVFDSVKKE